MESANNILAEPTYVLIYRWMLTETLSEEFTDKENKTIKRLIDTIVNFEDPEGNVIPPKIIIVAISFLIDKCVQMFLNELEPESYMELINSIETDCREYLEG